MTSYRVVIQICATTSASVLEYSTTDLIGDSWLDSPVLQTNKSNEDLFGRCLIDITELVSAIPSHPFVDRWLTHTDCSSCGIVSTTDDDNALDVWPDLTYG